MNIVDGILHFINPLNHIPHEAYESWWKLAFSTIFKGFWSRAIASVALILTYYFGVWRKNRGLGIVFYAIAILTTYVAGIFMRG